MLINHARAKYYSSNIIYIPILDVSLTKINLVDENQFVQIEGRKQI